MSAIRKIRRNMAAANGHDRLRFRDYGSRPPVSDNDPWYKHPSVVRKMRKLGILHPRNT